MANRGASAAVRRDGDEVSTSLKLERKGWGAWTLAAKGLYAGAAASAFSLVGVLLLCDPLKNPTHFVLAMVTAFAAGGFGQALATGGRLKDALARGDEYRAELQRVSAEKSKAEALLLQNRQSSATQSRPPRGKK